MPRVYDWVRSVKKESCEDCSSKEDLRVLVSGKTLCRKCYFKFHSKKKVSGKRKERPLSRNSHRDKLWSKIEEQEKTIQELGQELVKLKCQLEGV